MPEYITNKETRALNKYPPDGSDMGKVAKGTRILSTGTNSNGTYTGYKLPDGKFRCVPTADLDPYVVTPPPDPDPDPPPVETFTPPAEIMARWVIGLDATGTPIYSDYYYYFIEPA